jgi:hypothetical protein
VFHRLILPLVYIRNSYFIFQLLSTTGTVYLVFAFCEHDLCLLANNNVKLNLAEINEIMQQFLNVL